VSEQADFGIAEHGFAKPVPFDVTSRYVVGKRPLLISGRTLQPGDAFPWQSLGLTERRVRLLAEQRAIVVAPVKAPKSPTDAAASAPRK